MVRCHMLLVHGIEISPDKIEIVRKLQNERQYETIHLVTYGDSKNVRHYLSLISPISESCMEDGYRMRVPDTLHHIAKLDTYEYYRLLVDAGYNSEIPACQTEIICSLQDRAD